LEDAISTTWPQQYTVVVAAIPSAYQMKPQIYSRHRQQENGEWNASPHVSSLGILPTLP